MRTKRSNEAYVLIDHRNSPGISEEFMRANGLKGPAVGAGVTFESAMQVCHSCGGDVVLYPDRSRGAEWCSKHDAYLCDGCAARRKVTGKCVTLQQKVLKMFESFHKLGLRLVG